MIFIICGTCGTSKGYKTSADGAISLPASEEARLVRRGVAAYATKPIIAPEGGVATPGEGEGNGDPGVTSPDNGGGSASAESAENGNVDDAELQDGEAGVDDVLDVVDGHFTVESLKKLSRSALDDLGDDLGVDVRKCKNKGEAATMLAAVKVQTEGEEDAPPDLSAGAPMV